ncbi:MAG: hypothetical protein Q8O37_05645 [Sulfuricellaceae bacterium]|nr:hypothetical protein [Sulfuricellaceae bacterium]
MAATDPEEPPGLRHHDGRLSGVGPALTSVRRHLSLSTGSAPKDTARSALERNVGLS